MLRQPARSFAAPNAHARSDAMTQPRWSLAGAEYGRGEGSSATDFEPRSQTLQAVSSPGLYDPGVGKQVPLKERVRLGEITDSSRAVADRGCRLDDRLEDGLTGLLTETLIGHGQRCYLPGPGERHVNANPIGPIRQAGQSIPSPAEGELAKPSQRTGRTSFVIPELVPVTESKR
jgi:hypothetical protein